MSNVYDRAGSALRNDPLYVDPAALEEIEQEGHSFDESAQDEVRAVLRSASTPVFIAVLPFEAGEGNEDANTLGSTAGRRGTYLAVLPDGNSHVASDTVPPGAAGDAANDAAAASGGDYEAFLIDWVDRVESLAARDAGGAAGTGTGNGTTQPSGGSGLLPLAILAAAGGGGFLLYRRNKRQRELADLEVVRGALDDDITAYGEELADLDLDVRDDAVPEEARAEYGRALDLYEHAKSAADGAEHPGHLRPVTTALEEGRWLLACVRARLAGEPVPERRLPCFFDPRHGPSVADVEWAPPGGVPRNVPACQADIVRLREGADPDSRLVTVNGERRPYWEAGPAYNAWAAGYYGAILPGMLIGTMLGSSLAYGPAYAAGAEGGWGGGDGGWGDGGGFDGGFGGGGFDGGGFGGGFDGGF